MASKLTFLLAAGAFAVLEGGRPDASRASSFSEAAESSQNFKKKYQSSTEQADDDSAALTEVDSNEGNEQDQRSLLSDRSSNDDESESGAPAKRLAGENAKDGEQACYNELTVIGDINEDGAFSPQEWFDMFVKMDSVSHQQNWKLSEDEWRQSIPNCDFGCFQEYTGTKADENLDWYEWKNAMKLMDKANGGEDVDFMLEKSELVAAGLSGYVVNEGRTTEGQCTKAGTGDAGGAGTASTGGAGGASGEPSTEDAAKAELVTALNAALEDVSTPELKAAAKTACQAIDEADREATGKKDKCNEAGIDAAWA